MHELGSLRRKPGNGMGLKSVRTTNANKLGLSRAVGTGKEEGGTVTGETNRNAGGGLHAGDWPKQSVKTSIR